MPSIFIERKISLSTQTTELIFPLKDVSPELKASIEKINILHPDSTLGGNMTRRGLSSDSITLNLPKVKNFRTKFRIELASCNTSGLMTVFNLACSIKCCVMLFILNEEENQLHISIVSDNEDTYNLLQEVYKRVV